MCGIVGFVDIRRNENEDHLLGMVQTLNHRGPDGKGLLLHNYGDKVIGLGHTRLSIIDLTSAGSQPMTYENLTITFNGEIYNYQEIRKTLEIRGHQFKTRTDTEVILHSFKEWGINCASHFNGMFSIAIYDANEGTLYFCRDRAGVKPLYYYYDGKTLLFASELKAFHPHPAFSKELDISSLGVYFQYGYIPTPHSIFSNTYKLQSGTWLKFKVATHELSLLKYWDVQSFYRKPKLDISYQVAKEEVKRYLHSACNYRMIADVDVGVFLSGGYDSTAVAAILQTNSTNRLKTFTIGFQDGNNEAPYAKATAEYLGTNHTEYICTAQEAQQIIPQLAYYYDEPFADSSAIPTMLVSRIAREKVTVALSADGGDELFSGYDSYASVLKRLEIFGHIPGWSRSFFGHLAFSLQKLMPDNSIELKHKLTGICNSLNPDDYKQSAQLFSSMHSLPDLLSKNIFSITREHYKTSYQNYPTGLQDWREIPLAIDYQMYLQDDILTKVDRATMSASLEGREPLLDYQLTEFVAQLPFSYKYDGAVRKRLLKDIVHDYVPKHFLDRPKAGFSLPIYKWLQGDLSFLVSEYLCEQALSESGLFNTEFLVQQVTLFKKGRFHYKPFIWKLLMFQIWYKQWMSNRTW